MKQPKHPNVHVRLSDHDGNAFLILGKCCQAAREAGLSDAERSAFMREATSADYQNLLRTCQRWFACE